jgi:hypothetical protein
VKIHLVKDDEILTIDSALKEVLKLFLPEVVYLKGQQSFKGENTLELVITRMRRCLPFYLNPP